MNLITTLLISALTFVSTSVFAEELNCGDFSFRPVFESGTPSDLSLYEKMYWTPLGFSPIETWVKNEIILDASAVADAFVAKSKPLFTKEQMEIIKSQPGYTPSRHNLEEELTTGGQPKIIIKFKNPKELENATRNNVGKGLAMVLDGELIISVSLYEPISGGEAAIQGVFSEEKAEIVAQRIKQLSTCKGIGLTN